MAANARRLRALMRPASRLRYLVWRASGAAHDLTVSLRDGPRLIIRPAPAGDLSVAYEIFVEELYKSPRALTPTSAKRIVDVGANVGYASSYFAHCFPQAAIVAFEPHPAHLLQIERNLRANGVEGRVQVIPAAAGPSGRSAFLIDDGEASRIIEEPHQGRIAVQVVDFFDAIGKDAVDLLKLDCEGAEFDLLMDDRFATLDVRALVLEWHTSPQRPFADTAIFERLATLGFSLKKGSEYSIGGNRFGLLWAYRS